MKIGQIYKATKEDITDLIDQMEKDFGHNPFRETFERRLVEELVEKGWEIKESPVQGHENNLDYLLSLVPELYRTTKQLSESQKQYVETLLAGVSAMIPILQRTAETTQQAKESLLGLYLKNKKPANKLPC